MGGIARDSLCDLMTVFRDHQDGDLMNADITYSKANNDPGFVLMLCTIPVKTYLKPSFAALLAALE